MKQGQYPQRLVGYYIYGKTRNLSGVQWAEKQGKFGERKQGQNS